MLIVLSSLCLIWLVIYIALGYLRVTRRINVLRLVFMCYPSQSVVRCSECWVFHCYCLFFLRFGVSGTKIRDRTRKVTRSPPSILDRVWREVRHRPSPSEGRSWVRKVERVRSTIYRDVWRDVAKWRLSRFAHPSLLWRKWNYFFLVSTWLL